jgi:hypothetical protein
MRVHTPITIRRAANCGSGHSPASAALQGGHAALPATVKTWTAPASDDPIAVGFEQHIGATDALRTGTYSTTLTLTLSTTNP